MPTVVSKDGTIIAYDMIGAGPAVILVDGALGFRSFGGASELATLLAPDFTVYAYDRRGRGASTDTKPFAVAREVEDIEALIDAAGGEAYVYGISSGGALALETAIGLPGKVAKLAIYEVPYDSSPGSAEAWHTYRTSLDALIAAGRRGDAVALFMKFVGAPDDMIAGMRQSPMWPALESVAPTLPYDAAELGVDREVPIEQAATVNVPTLIMDGGASYEAMPFMRATAEALAAAIPRSQRQTLEGQRHDVDAKALAPVLRAFLAS
ncbi:MAG TPA: alpha/beta hydrolase [Ktedonobacterales bacterium]|jgi:pimeloyl-ACP methyl ester carboxylesterase|nr:alpha/beta hydrolase [Ktedonobacterales bacterium]